MYLKKILSHGDILHFCMLKNLSKGWKKLELDRLLVFKFECQLLSRERSIQSFQNGDRSYNLFQILNICFSILEWVNFFHRVSIFQLHDDRMEQMDTVGIFMRQSHYLWNTSRLHANYLHYSLFRKLRIHNNLKHPVLKV